MAKLGDLELRPSERAPSTAEPIPLRRDAPPINKAVFVAVSDSLDIGHKPAAGLRRTLWPWLWPWAWLVVTGVVTLGWLIGIGWAAVELVKRFAG
jgi:hypothetical protein